MTVGLWKRVLNISFLTPRRWLTKKASPSSSSSPKLDPEWSKAVEKELKGTKAANDLIWHTPEVMQCDL